MPSGALGLCPFWAFPTRDRDGRVVPVQEPKVKGLPSPHRLRDTFVAACVQSGVGMVEIKTLVNHSLPSNPDDVTEGYYRPSVEHLRGCVERATVFLLKRMH